MPLGDGVSARLLVGGNVFLESDSGSKGFQRLRLSHRWVRWRALFLTQLSMGIPVVLKLVLVCNCAHAVPCLFQVRVWLAVGSLGPRVFLCLMSAPKWAKAVLGQLQASLREGLVPVP